MAIFSSAIELIGATPVVRADRFRAENGLFGELFVKLEKANPGGSAKDRVALAMIEAAEARGELAAGGTVIEPTSGNTGIGLAVVCAVKGYRLILTMPSSMSVERVKTLRSLGATVVLTDAEKGMSGAIEEAEHILSTTENAIIAGQFVNPENANAHRRTTAKEIISDFESLDCFVAGVGTGGTLTGVGEELKKAYGNVTVLAVEPFDSPLLSKGRAGAHKIQGIGANFVPAILNRDIIDEIAAVKTEEAYSAARSFTASEGVSVGISGGAALFAAAEYMKKNPGKRVLVLLPDGGERYLSTDLFD